MFQNLLFLVCLSFVGQAMATPPKMGKGAFIIGDRIYAIDTAAARNRAQALAFCESKGGELAKMSGKSLYNIIQASTTTVGGYWIDGIDKPTADRFSESTGCTSTKLEFKDISPANLEFSPQSCLLFNKGSTVATTKIQAVSCTTAQKGVVCAIPINDCDAAPTSPPVESG